MEDDRWWKTTFGGSRPLVEDDLWRKTSFGGRRPSVKDKVWWRITFGGRRPLVEDDLRWQMTFGGRRPLMEDNLRWKATFGGKPLRVLVSHQSPARGRNWAKICWDHMRSYMQIIRRVIPPKNFVCVIWHFTFTHSKKNKTRWSIARAVHMIDVV